MATSRSLALQGCINTVLENTTALTALVSSGIFDRPPPQTALPFVSFGHMQDVDDGTSGYDAGEVFFDIDCWSQAVGSVEAKKIAAAVRTALHDQATTVAASWPAAHADQRLVDIRVTREMTFSPAEVGDGVTTRVTVTVRALIELA